MHNGGVAAVLSAVLAVLLASLSTQDGGAGREVTIALDAIPAGAACPSSAQVGEALDARLPGITAARDHRSASDRLRLQLEDIGAAGLRLALVDLAGRTLLERSLAGGGGAPGGRPGACAAVAETIALVVERYVRQLGYRAPKLVTTVGAPTAATIGTAPAGPEPEPSLSERLALGAGASLGPGTRGASRIGPEIVMDLITHRLLLSLRVAVTWPIERSVPSTDNGVFRYAALPVRAGIGLPFALPRHLGWAAITALAGVDLYRAETRQIAVPATVDGVQPVAEVGVATALRVGRSLAVRPQVALEMRRERVFQLQDPALMGSPLFEEGPFSVRFGLDLVIALGKN
jgi:hypothetical protein